LAVEAPPKSRFLAARFILAFSLFQVRTAVVSDIHTAAVLACGIADMCVEQNENTVVAV
jgi:hypothetical protein